MAEGADGSYVAAPIWRSFMEQAVKNYAIEEFPKYKEDKSIEKSILKGDFEVKEEIKVCKIPGKKDKYCLATDACPEDEVEKKKFTSAHTILYYVNKEDPRGEVPKDPGRDPQFKNWEKAVEKWVEDNKDYKGNDAPTKKCETEDFGDADISVSIKDPSDGDTITSSPFTIKAEVSADYGIDNVELMIDGDKVKETSDSDISYSYSIPDSKKSSTIEIEVGVKDESGNGASESIKIHTNIP